MMRETFTIAAAAFLCIAGTTPPVTFESRCECRGAQGKGRIAIKNEPSTPPEAANAIQRVTPSDICSWPGPDVDFTEQSKRTGIENNWYGLAGGVVAVKG
jgi:hypothetical protein